MKISTKPSDGQLFKFLEFIRDKCPFKKRFVALFLVIFWLLLVVPVWGLIKIGNFGHAFGNWCGFETKEW